MIKLISRFLLLMILYSSQAVAGMEWVSLDSEIQSVLRPFETQWNTYSTARQEKLLLGAQRWVGMDKDQRAAVSSRYQRWQKLGPEKQAELGKRFSEFGELTADQRRLLRERMKIFKRLPKAQQDKLRNKFRRMSPENKARALERLKRRNATQHQPRKPMKDKNRRRTDEREKDTAGSVRSE